MYVYVTVSCLYMYVSVALSVSNYLCDCNSLTLILTLILSLWLSLWLLFQCVCPCLCECLSDCLSVWSVSLSLLIPVSDCLWL